MADTCILTPQLPYRMIPLKLRLKKMTPEGSRKKQRDIRLRPRNLNAVIPHLQNGRKQPDSHRIGSDPKKGKSHVRAHRRTCLG